MGPAAFAALLAAAPPPAVPAEQDIAGALAWEGGRLCRELIDHCTDENGNAPEPRFGVRDVACRPLRGDRAACAFSAAQVIGGQHAPFRRCSGTLGRGVHPGGAWTFEPRSRRNSRGRMRCS